MNNVFYIAEFRKLKLKEKLKITWNSSIWFWFINKFHVHEWKDEQAMPVINKNENYGTVFIQQCTLCKLRSSQKMDYVGVSERVPHK